LGVPYRENSRSTRFPGAIDFPFMRRDKQWHSRDARILMEWNCCPSGSSICFRPCLRPATDGGAGIPGGREVTPADLYHIGQAICVGIMLYAIARILRG